MSDSNSAFEAGRSAGFAVGMILPLLIGIVVALRQRARRGDGTFPALPVLIGLAITILGLLGQGLMSTVGVAP